MITHILVLIYIVYSAGFFSICRFGSLNFFFSYCFEILHCIVILVVTVKTLKKFFWGMISIFKLYSLVSFDINIYTCETTTIIKIMKYWLAQKVFSYSLIILPSHPFQFPFMSSSIPRQPQLCFYGLVCIFYNFIYIDSYTMSTLLCLPCFSQDNHFENHVC